jgi:ribonucleoside-diphosphate reductase alpha chain
MASKKEKESLPKNDFSNLEENIKKSSYHRDKVNPKDIEIDNTRDELLTAFGKATLTDRYLLPNETYQEMFVRVASTYADNLEHAQRLYGYFSKLWAMPSTPILSNGGAGRGQSISCFLNRVGDSIPEILENWKENAYLATNGGGVATSFSDVRSIGEPVSIGGKTSGIIPFIVILNSISLGMNQGGNRAGSIAIYLYSNHPEIEEFLEMRKPTGDFNRKALALHHAIVITNDFMEAVKKDGMYPLISPKTKQVVKLINARTLWQKILETRITTGEPYLLFIDTVNENIPEHHKQLGLNVSMSNLCSEIVLPTGEDHLGNERSAVCCLSSLNLEYWEEWKNNLEFVEDMVRFLDNVLQDFIENAPNEIIKAKYSAYRERSIGLGVMGFHSLLQSKMIPFESVTAKVLNMKIFKHIKQEADLASKKLASERGSCPDAEEIGIQERFSNKIAIAPTASISIICGGSSPGIEPYPATIYTHKTLSGSFTVRNKYLNKLFEDKGLNLKIMWEKILNDEGSVQNLEELTPLEKDVFKNAFEIDQRYIIEFAADRTPYICQAQSLNLFLQADIHKYDLHMLHFTAWEKGIKSLYYCRSKSLQRASIVTEKAVGENIIEPEKYSECISCQ